MRKSSKKTWEEFVAEARERPSVERFKVTVENIYTDNRTVRLTISVYSEELGWERLETVLGIGSTANVMMHQVNLEDILEQG